MYPKVVIFSVAHLSPHCTQNLLYYKIYLHVHVFTSQLAHTYQTFLVYNSCLDVLQLDCKVIFSSIAVHVYQPSPQIEFVEIELGPGILPT